MNDSEWIIFSDIQSVATISGLPIILSIFSVYRDAAIPSFSEQEILQKVKEDLDLSQAGISINDNNALKAILKDLTAREYLEPDSSNKTKLILTSKGEKACGLLLKSKI